MLGRFLSADTIVPSPGNPQSLNRYAYTLNNPVKYTDPTGHYVYEEECQDPTDHGFSTGPYTHADTYFLGPTTAIYSRGVAGDPVQVVSIPAQRVSMATVNDPTGFAGTVAGLYALAPGSVRGGILPGGGASFHVPASLQNDVFPEPSFDPAATGPGAAETVRLRYWANQATRKVDAMGQQAYSPDELKAMARNKNLAAPFHGTAIHEEFFPLVDADPKLSHLQTAVSGQKMPDVVNPQTGQWWDLTTTGAWQAHLRKYIPLFGPNGTLLWHP